MGHRRELLPAGAQDRRRRRKRGRKSCGCSPIARGSGTPVTFRAAGTSLSGQAVTDSVLVLLGDNWRGCRISRRRPDRSRCSRASSAPTPTAASRRFGRKIGPDPASINAAMIGGIAANNASGMCCGTAQNSYQTLAGDARRARRRHACSTPRDRREPRGVPAHAQADLVERLDAPRPAARGRRGAGRAHPAQVQDEEHHRLQPQRAGRLRRPDRHPRAPDDRLGRHARLHRRDHVSTPCRSTPTRPAR